MLSGSLYINREQEDRCETDIESAVPQAARSTDVIVVRLPLGPTSFPVNPRQRAVTYIHTDDASTVSISDVKSCDTSALLWYNQHLHEWDDDTKCRWVKLIRTRCKFNEFNEQLGLDCHVLLANRLLCDPLATSFRPHYALHCPSVSLTMKGYKCLI